MFPSFLKPYKPLLVTLGIVLLIVIVVPLVGVWAVEGYVKKTVYPDLSLVVYEEAQDAIAKTSWAWLGEPLLSLDDAWLKPKFFLHASDVQNFTQEHLYAYDDTKEPALFTVTGLGTKDKNVALEVVYPSVAKGTTLESQVGCSLNLTTATEAMTNDPAKLASAVNKDGSLNLDAIQGAHFTKTYTLNQPVFDFLKALLQRSDIKAGTKTIQLGATCNSFDCTVVGPECSIQVVYPHTN